MTIDDSAKPPTDGWSRKVWRGITFAIAGGAFLAIFIFGLRQRSLEQNLLFVPLVLLGATSYIWRYKTGWNLFVYWGRRLLGKSVTRDGSKDSN